MKYTKRSPQGGFTLIELLIVMAILGMLAAIVGPSLWSKLAGAKRDTAATQISSIEAALDSYRLDSGKYPSTLEALLRNTENSKTWQGPYLKKTKEVPTDPWGNPYQYKKPGNDGRDYDLYSFGADGVEGGDDENADVR